MLVGDPGVDLALGFLGGTLGSRHLPCFRPLVDSAAAELALETFYLGTAESVAGPWSWNSVKRLTLVAVQSYVDENQNVQDTSEWETEGCMIVVKAVDCFAALGGIGDGVLVVLERKADDSKLK